jgi:hypothetical protein
MVNTWGAADHKPIVDAAIARLQKDAKSKPARATADTAASDAAVAPPLRRNSEPNAAAAFAAAAADDHHGFVKKNPMKPQPPSGSKIQVNPAADGAVPV